MSDIDSYSLLPGMIDSHFHYLEMEKKEMDSKAILEKCFAYGMEYALDIATSTNNFDKRLEFAKLFDRVYLTAGLSPGKADKSEAEIEAMLLELEKQLDAGTLAEAADAGQTGGEARPGGGSARGVSSVSGGSGDSARGVSSDRSDRSDRSGGSGGSARSARSVSGVSSDRGVSGGSPVGSRIAGVGETGLDWHWNHGTREKQLHLFESQLALAEKKRLPVIIHNRDADRDVAESLGRHKLSKGGIIHCFSSDYSFAKKCADLGFLISFAGNVTYKKNTNLHEAAAKLPLDCILAETDAPYLAPGKMRGKLNHPGLIGMTYSYLSELRKTNIESVVYTVKNNFKTLFSLL